MQKNHKKTKKAREKNVEKYKFNILKDKKNMKKLVTKMI